MCVARVLAPRPTGTPALLPHAAPGAEVSVARGVFSACMKGGEPWGESNGMPKACVPFHGNAPGVFSSAPARRVCGGARVAARNGHELETHLRRLVGRRAEGGEGRCVGMGWCVGAACAVVRKVGVRHVPRPRHATMTARRSGQCRMLSVQSPRAPAYRTGGGASVAAVRGAMRYNGSRRECRARSVPTVQRQHCRRWWRWVMERDGRVRMPRLRRRLLQSAPGGRAVAETTPSPATTSTRAGGGEAACLQHSHARESPRLPCLS